MKKKILFAAQNLAVGGIQTSLINLLIHLDKEHCDEYEIDLFTFGKGEFLPFVPENVNVICGNTLLGLASTPFMSVVESRKITDIFLRILLMLYVRIVGSDAFYRTVLEKHRTKKEYEVAISYFNDAPNNYFNRGTNLYVSDFTHAGKKVAWIHNDPIEMGFSKDHCIKTYKSFDKIYCVSGAVKEKFDLLLPEYKDKTEVFYNIFCPELIKKRSEEFVPFEKRGFNIVTVCRVDNFQKRVDGIVRLAGRLKDDGVEGFKWRIVGGGPDLKGNKKLARELGVEDVVEFIGETINPYPYIKNSDLFALYSAFEGHPMVIGETQVLGVKIITTNYAAAKEQINEDQGIICENDEVFYETIKRLILEA